MQGPAGVSRGWEATVAIITVVVTALFAPAWSQTKDVALLLQQTPREGGTITPGPGVHFFALNSEVVLRAIPSPGYEFSYWLGDVGDSTAHRTTTYLNKPKVVVAVFEPIEYSSAFMGVAPVGSGRRRISAGSLTAAADYAGWGQAGMTSTWSGPLASQIPKLYHQAQEPLPPTPSEPPIPEPMTLLLLGVGSVMLARKARRHA